MEPTQNGGVRPQHDVGPHLLCRTDRGRGIRGEAGGGERRSSDQPETKERGTSGDAGEKRTRGAELSRPPGFVWSLGRGSCFDLGEGLGARGQCEVPPNLCSHEWRAERCQRGPSPSQTPRSRSRPAPSHRRSTALLDWGRQEGKVGHPPGSRRRVSEGPLTVKGLLLAAADRE